MTIRDISTISDTGASDSGCPTNQDGDNTPCVATDEPPIPTTTTTTIGTPRPLPITGISDTIFGGSMILITLGLLARAASRRPS